MKGVVVDPKVDEISMPENLRVGLFVTEQRKRCSKIGCNAEFYGFGFGQSPFHVPPPLERSLGENARMGHYSAAEGIEELREAISGFNKRHFSLDVDPSRIVVGHGTKGLMYALFSIIGGSFIIPSPSWIGYAPQLKLHGKDYHVFFTKPENGYKIDPLSFSDFLSKLPEEQHLLILNNPHNPTGAVYSRKELEKIAEVCRMHSTLVLADEIYALTTYRFENFTSMGRIYPEGSFVTNGLSKDRSAGGYRLGSCILPENCSEKLREDFTKVAATVYTNVSTPTQNAAVTAYEPNEEIEEYFRITREVHRIMGTEMSRAFNEIDGIKATTPEGAFYFLADFNDLLDDLELKGVKTSNDLARSIIDHPYHITTITGDAIMVKPDDFSARIAFVDYDGKEAFDDFRVDPPKTRSEEAVFARDKAPRMFAGRDMLKKFAEYIKKSE
jgi:aspartate aminotransferase